MPISSCRTRLSCLLAATLSLVAACSSSGNSGTTGTIQRRPTGGTTGSVGSSLGQACNSDADCGGGLTCFTNVPGGYCSTNCDTDANCPAGGSCVLPLPGEQICVSSCPSVNDCIRAGYACDTDCSVCVPDGTQTLVSCAGHEAGGGGHLPDGGACGVSLGDGGFVNWSAAIEVSANPLTSSEAQGVLLVGGGISLTSAFMVVPEDAGSPPPQNWIGLAMSLDDGAGFTSQAPIADEPGTVVGDPSLAMDSSGNQYLAYFGYDPSRGGIAHLWVATSQAGGSWSSPQDVLGPGDLADAGGGVDWPFLAVNPVTHQPLIVFADFDGLFGGFGPYRIKLIAGQPGGSSFLPSVGVDDGTRLAFRDLPSMAFDQTGMVYLTWVEASDPTTVAEDQATGVELTGSTTNAVYFTTATVRDGGAVTVAPSNRLVSGDAGESIVVDSAHLTVEPDGTEVFVTYVVAGASGGTDIELAVSHNQGFTWPVHTVVDDQPGCATHFHPSPFLDIKNRLWVSWVDNRDGAGNVYCAFSSNSGVSFSASQLVSSQAFFFTTLIPSPYGNVPAWLGGSQMLTGSDTELYSMWTGAQGGTSNSSPAHVYFAKAPLP